MLTAWKGSSAIGGHHVVFCRRTTTCGVTLASCRTEDECGNQPYPAEIKVGTGGGFWRRCSWQPAVVAQALYVESEASRERRAAERAVRAAERAGYQAPETKPDKRARRLIRALGDIDAL